MMRNKILALVLIVGVVSGVGIVAKNYDTFAAKPMDQNIKVTAYKAAAKVNENGFQIDKYANVESVAWLNDNEVITLTKKGELKNPDSSENIRYCSIYNLNTKSSRDFKDVNIRDFMGVSPDKKYILYAEARNIPKIGSEEWQKAYDSGELLHKNVKLLNLTTGEITTINTEKLNSDAEFVWINNNKILANYFNKWAILDLAGKVCDEGSYNVNSMTTPWIAGTDDIKETSSGLEGKLYYTQSESGIEGSKLMSMDIKTKEIKTLYSNQYAGNADKKGKTAIMGVFDNHGAANAQGVFVNRTFGAVILDESGQILRNVNLPAGKIGLAAFIKNYILSPDGSKAIYVETSNNISGGKDADDDTAIKVIDTKTGSVKEIVKTSTLKDENEAGEYYTAKIETGNGQWKEKRIHARPSISNLCWDKSGTAVSFTYGNSMDQRSNSNVNTYIISFDN